MATRFSATSPPWDDFEYGAIAASKAGVTPALVRTLDAALVEILR